VRKAYLKRYSAGYIKGSPSKRHSPGSAYRTLEAMREKAREMGRGERLGIFSDGKQIELWTPGPNPRHVVEKQMLDQEISSKIMMQTDRAQKRQVYNKVVLKSTGESVVTMYFSGSEVFLIEDYPDGTYRQSLQSSSTSRMKALFEANRVPWRGL
jgi:hypothetical protein